MFIMDVSKRIDWNLLLLFWLKIMRVNKIFLIYVIYVYLVLVLC